MPIQNNPQRAGEEIKQREGGGSLLFASPLSAFKYYLHPAGLGIVSATARFGSRIPVLPTGIGNFAIGHFGNKIASKYLPSLVSNRLTQNIFRTVAGAGATFGPHSTIRYELETILGVADDVRSTIMRTMGKAFRDKSLFNLGNSKLAFAKVIERVATTATAKHGAAVSTVLASLATNESIQGAVKSGMAITRFGSFMTFPSLAVTGAWLGGKLAGLAFKSGVAAVEYATARAESIRSLEFGGSMGSGYTSSASANERQRAINAIQRNHLEGRRGLGLEAQNYSALI